ncbi:DsbA family oxidoreductase [Chitinophaga oryziterrae]
MLPKFAIMKMKVEIWSDVMCPFCYIGKRKFEAAMSKFTDAAGIEVEWHSFQLDPTIKSGHDKDLYQYLSERKGIPYEQAVQMNAQVAATAAAAGITFNPANAVVANSFDAHRLIHLAKKNNLGDEAEERLFKSYFTESKDFGDHAVLTQLGKEIGLDEASVKETLASDAYAKDVNADINEAQALGIRGVPFFVFDRKYAVSGAQASEIFLEVLDKSFAEWRKENPASPFETIEGEVCTPDGECK